MRIAVAAAVSCVMMFSVTMGLQAQEMDPGFDPLPPVRPAKPAGIDAAVLTRADSVFTATVEQVEMLAQTHSIPPSILMKVTVKDPTMLKGEKPKALAFSHSAVQGRGFTPEADQKVIVAAAANRVVAMVEATDEAVAAVKKALAQGPGPAQPAAIDPAQIKTSAAQAKLVFTATVESVKTTGQLNTKPPVIQMDVTIKDLEVFKGKKPESLTLPYWAVQGQGFVPKKDERVLAIANEVLTAPIVGGPPTLPGQRPQIHTALRILLMVPATKENVDAARTGIGDLQPGAKPGQAGGSPPREPAPEPATETPAVTITQPRLVAPEPPLDADATKLPELLDDAAAGKLPLDDVIVFCRSGSHDFVLYGTRFGFVGTTQIKPGKDVVLAAIKRIQKASFAKMPDSFGGNPNPNVRGRRPMMPVQLLREFSVTIGKAAKTVTQLGGGEQSQELLDLISGIEKDLAPLAEKGLKLDAVSLKDGLALLAKGDLAPEALTISFASTPRNRKDQDMTAIMVIQTAEVRIHVIQAAMVRIHLNRVEMKRADAEALVKRLAGLLAEKDLAAFPRQLYAPGELIGLDIRLHGIASTMNLSADVGPYNQRQAKAHPESQKAFEQIVVELRQVHKKLSPPPPDNAKAR